MGIVFQVAETENECTDHTSLFDYTVLDAE